MRRGPRRRCRPGGPGRRSATAALIGIPQAAAGELTLGVVGVAAAIALLHPVLPFAFEMLALRRMTVTAFGTLMAVEPAIGLLLGLVVLHQRPTVGQVVGIALVVTAGAAAQRRRPQPAAAARSTGSAAT